MGYYFKILPEVSKRICPITSLLRKGVHVLHESHRAHNLVKCAAPRVLVFPNREAFTDGSRPFYVCCDACIDVCGADLEQEQPGGSA